MTPTPEPLQPEPLQSEPLQSEPPAPHHRWVPPHPHWDPGVLPRALHALPSWAARLAMEARMPAEVARWAVTPETYGLRLPTAPPGAPGVLLVPGFGFGDTSVTPMRLLLRRLGYRTYTSGIHLNVRCSELTVEHLARTAERVTAAERARGHAGRITVVGQSRGGMLARGIGARRPDLVGAAVNIGGCLNDEFAFYEIPRPFLVAIRSYHHAIDGDLRRKQCGTSACSCDYMRASHRPMPAGVRLVSIYSRQDGIVDWRSCVVPGAENVEVGGSHLGMGFTAPTLRALAGVLATTA